MVPLLFSKIGTRSKTACYETVAQGSLTIDYLNSMTQFSGKPSKYEKLLNVRFFTVAISPKGIASAKL